MCGPHQPVIFIRVNRLPPRKVCFGPHCFSFPHLQNGPKTMIQSPSPFLVPVEDEGNGGQVYLQLKRQALQRVFSYSPISLQPACKVPPFSRDPRSAFAPGSEGAEERHQLGCRLGTWSRECCVIVLSLFSLIMWNRGEGRWGG